MGAERYHRKPVPVEAWQVTPDNAEAAAAWVMEQGGNVVTFQPRIKRLSGIEATHAFKLRTPAGWEHAWVRYGDYVVHDPHGFTVVTPDLFAAAYEPVEGVPDAAADR